MVHEMKIIPEYFQAVINGNKSFEIRRNDRDFSVGDVLLLNEYNAEQNKYTGRRVRVKIIYITNYAQVENYVVMGIKFE
jgi:ASC-1-like (ASCH) protein